MPVAAVPLPELAQRLAKKQSELENLRRLYEARLADLKRRKEELENRLHQVDSEIQTVTQESPEAAATATRVPRTPRAKKGRRLKGLPGLILALLKEAGQPLTVKQLAEEVRRRKFPTKSKNIRGLVQTRVLEMAKKGVLAHAKGQPGYVVKSHPGPSTTSPNGRPRKEKQPGRKTKAAKPSGPSGGSQPPLREVLTKILQQCKDPIGGGELAEKALETGYQSKSKSFRDVVWVNLGNMANVEHVPGKGYRLKKR